MISANDQQAAVEALQRRLVRSPQAMARKDRDCGLVLTRGPDTVRQAKLAQFNGCTSRPGRA